MFLFPAIISPDTAIIGVLLPFIVIPVASIAFVIWHVRKLNSIERTTQEILDKLKSN